MKRKTRIPTLFALGVGAMAGCGGTQAAQPEEAHPVDYIHQGVDSPPTLDLATYKAFPVGVGVRPKAGSVGVVDRSVDYGLALRTASLKLRGDLPTLAEIRRLQTAVAAGANDGSDRDPAKVYGDLVQSYINTPQTFNRQMVQYWRNVLRMGDSISGLFGDSTSAVRGVSLETGPAFAARLVAEDRDMRLLFTQDRNACPTFDPATSTFRDGNCTATGTVVVNGVSLASMGNNVPEGQQAGILTNPGFQATYFSNMGFRRARVIQEIFACTRYPAEFAAMPKQIGSTLYASPWPEYSVTSSDLQSTRPSWTIRRVRGGGTTNSRDYVDFSLARGCQGCHTTLNRRAPLFAGFDQVGYYNPTQYMVPAPVTDSPWAQIQDYLPAGNQQLAWKFGKPTNTFQEFGRAMAEDPQVHQCFVIRAWNHAYSRDDVVQDLALVPESVTKELVAYFVSPTGGNFNFKKLLYRLYTDANFIRF